MSGIEPAYRYRAKLNRVVDADTLLLDVDLGFRITAAVPVRVRGVNAPEMSTPAGKIAFAWTNEFLVGKSIVIETYKDHRSFERWVADVYVDGRGFDLILIEAGQGVRYP